MREPYWQFSDVKGIAMRFPESFVAKRAARETKRFLDR
jgi:hypothetical protein